VKTCGGVIAYIGIGGNLGDPRHQCRKAISSIGVLPETKLLRTSSFYRTEPLGFREQPDFINAVAEVRTLQSPRDLLRGLKKIEAEMGREQTHRWGPRIIDLDIILYGQEVVAEDDLVIPHPECHRRRFVLVPCCELAPYAIHPRFGISLRGLLQRLETEKGGRVEAVEE